MLQFNFRVAFTHSKSQKIFRPIIHKMNPIYIISIVYFLCPFSGMSQRLEHTPSSAADGTHNRRDGYRQIKPPSTVYPLPEIQIKLENGSTLEVESNSPVVLSQQLHSVELSCTADYPVKWEYLVKNKTIPLLDVVYHRIIRSNVSEFTNPKRNRFMSLVKLKGLLESQTGKYLCRNYNDKLDNNSYAISSFFDIFIPGGKTFNTISSAKFINKTAPYVDIPCPVTDPLLHVRLYKLNEKQYMQTGKIVWKPVYANYEPTDGFRLLAGLGRNLLGTWNCTADDAASVIVDVVNLSEKELYLSSSPASFTLGESCWENAKLLRYIRSQKLECFCNNSYGLFVNGETYEFENRQANCSMEVVLEKLENCSDWRLMEYFMNSEESRDSCFTEPLQSVMTQGGDQSGSRPSLKVNGKTFPGGDNQENSSFTLLNITYNGFIDWAGDFKLAICRTESCQLEFNEDGTIRSGENSRNLEYLGIEPSRTQYFPMAHYQARWNDVLINGTDIKRVYVFQAHSLSYAWFPYSTTEIEYDDHQSLSPILPEVGQRNPSDSSSASSAAGAAVVASTFYYGINGFFLYTKFIILPLINIAL